MRQLTEHETKLLFSKLLKYISPESIKLLVDRPDKKQHHFRLIRENRVYYISADITKLASTITKTKLVSLGIRMGKFDKSFKSFRLSITALSLLAPLAKYKIWLKPSSSIQNQSLQGFLYGNNVTKSSISKMSENIPKYSGVFIFSSSTNVNYEIPLGFGVASKSTQESRSSNNPQDIICFHQADIGEYLRHENELC
ncbi:unnamed protein product [Gordionus sp. m RMFG-2023]|uniref:60S ribosome subunit biogenesis protein NIP7 homolog n=1 Tax=Gordionus sp. m RMFG-2023 TaxID=3053472 RepID=UPI0030E0018B